MIPNRSHIVGIYPNQKAELNHALQFLRRGLDNNESVILITDFAPRERIRDIMSSIWDTKDIGKLEQNGDLSIASSAEWYLTEENTSRTNIDKIVNAWSRLS